MIYKKIVIGILCGLLAGMIDLIPMIIQNLPVSADLSALSMWIIIGFILSITEWKINPVLKGIIISFLILTPSAIIIGWGNPAVLIPIFIMTLILGGFSGFLIDYINQKY